MIKGPTYHTMSVLPPIYIPNYRTANSNRRCQRINNMLREFEVPNIYSIMDILTELHTNHSDDIDENMQELKSIAWELQSAIYHRVPGDGMAAGMRACIMANILLINLETLEAVLLGNCTREFLMQFTSDPIPRIIAAYNLHVTASMFE